MFFYTPESYNIVASWHDGLARAGVPYWITIWDETLRRIAQIRTREYLHKHPEDPFPYRKVKEEE